MNVTIFGANGAIGKIVVNQALTKGDTVTAYVRRSGESDRWIGNPKIAIGELTDQALIEKAVKDADVVISALGPALDTSRKKKGTPIADGHSLIIQAMEKFGRRRFVTLGTPSIHSDDDRKSFVTIVPAILASIILPNAYRDMVRIGELIRASSLDWTVVRITNPNVEHKGQGYRVSLGDTKAGVAVSRENVGEFMYRVASENLYIRKMPIVFDAPYFFT